MNVDRVEAHTRLHINLSQHSELKIWIKKISSTRPFSLKVFSLHSFSSFALHCKFYFFLSLTHWMRVCIWCVYKVRIIWNFVQKIESFIRRIVVITHQFCAGRSTFQSCVCVRGSFTFGNRLWLRTFFPIFLCFFHFTILHSSFTFSSSSIPFSSFNLLRLQAFSYGSVRVCVDFWSLH